MLKSAIILVGLGLIAASGPASAQSVGTPVWTCTQADIDMVNARGMKMSDPAKKAAHTQSMTMAKEMMAKNDLKGCTVHLDESWKNSSDPKN